MSDQQMTNKLEQAVAEGQDLSGVNLSGAKLKGAYLRGANLEGAILIDATLVNANLAGANLAGAYLRGANMEGANMEGVSLSGANLVGANLKYAYMARANLSGAYYSVMQALMADWAECSEALTLELMRVDCACLPNGQALFDAWAKGGQCPYRDQHQVRELFFREQREVWSYGPALSVDELWALIVEEKGITV
jgi:hypothetical protein